MINRIALVIQYDGSGFSGWQNQKNFTTIQGTIEEKIAELDPIRPVKVIAAGRTDSGVHASGQVVHFDYSGPIPINKWSSALNGRLPSSIKVLEAVHVPIDWHACYSAKYRRYRYSIFNGCDDDSKSNDAKFQCKTGHLYHVNANKWDVVIWKIERGDFESALSLIVDLKKRRDDYLEDVSQQPVSKNLNKELSLDGVHKRLNKKQQEVRQKISNIPDEVFNEKNFSNPIKE